MEIINTHLINIYAATYIINADYSALDDNELAQLDEYLAETAGDLVLTDQEPKWARCDITGLWSDCHTYNEYKR